MKKLILLLAVFLLLSTLHTVEAIPEVTVKEGKPINVTVTAKNTGTKLQEDWLVGIDFYKVTDYSLVKVGKSDPYSEGAIIRDSRVRVNMYRGKGGIDCFHGDGRIIPNSDCDCYYTGLTVMDYLNPGQSVNVTCEISPSFWLSKWGLMSGNERIMVWVHETIDEKDLDRSGQYEWWRDALAWKAPAGIIINTVPGPKAEVDVENVKVDCNQKGRFKVTVKNTGDIALSGLTVRDELWTDTDGDVDTTTDRYVYDSFTRADVNIPVGGTWPPEEWTMSKNLLTKPLYFHKLTVSSAEGVLDEKEFYNAFRCKPPEPPIIYKLKLNAITEPEYTDFFTWAKVYNSTGHLVCEVQFSELGSCNLLPGLHSIKVQPSFNTEYYGWRHFSHFWDHDCDGTGDFLDSAENPYVFTMYGKDKEMTVIYKGFTFINFDYNGTHIFGNLNNERGYGVLEKCGRSVPCGVSDPAIQNWYVDLYYEKDGKWYPIGKALTDYSIPGVEDRDGSFSYEWHCIPSVTRLKAVYNPYGWNYAPSSVEEDFSCDINVNKVEIGVEGKGSCYVECTGGECPVRGGFCPDISCGDEIKVNLNLENKGKLGYSPVEVKLILAEVEDKTGKIIRKVERGGNLNIDAGKQAPSLSFSIPSFEFEGMKEGNHFGVFIDLRGKIGGTDYYVTFPSINDPIPIDNSKIYPAKCCPHLDFWCDMRCKVGELCNCAAIYTHDEGDEGKIHFHVSGTSSISFSGNCFGGGDEPKILECYVKSGDTVKISFYPSSQQGILNVYARARDNTKEYHQGSCYYSLDPEPTYYSYCSEIEDWNSRDSLTCDAKVVTIDVDAPKSPDLVINDIFSYDSLLGYEIANRGSSGAFPSKTNLTIDGSFITTNDAGFLLPGDVRQYAFSGINWKSYCSGNDDTVNVKVCADHLNDVEESNEGNNCREENLACCTPTSSVEICDNFVDDNCNGLIDCKDSDCRGAITPLGVCCQLDTNCSAKDSNDGTDEFERGICTPYSCNPITNLCSAQPQKIDSCDSTSSLLKYYVFGHECLSEGINCPDGYYCYDGACTPKECSSEICDNFRDDDCDGKIDCVDEDCSGQPGPLGMTCCQSDPDCSAVDTDGGFDPSEFGACTPYTCISKVCKAGSSSFDSCPSTSQLYEYSPNPSAPNSCKQDTVTCSNGICDAGRCLACQGQVELNLIPDKVLKKGAFTFSASGLSGCNGKTVHFKESSCTGTERISCNIGSDGTGCLVGFTAPGSAGTYTYFACVDKNGDDFYASDEMNSKELEVTTGCVYSLDLVPAEGSSTSGIYEPTITATDKSSGCIPPITYTVQNSTDGDCSVSSVPTSITYPPNPNSFTPTFTMTGNRPCTVELRIIAPDGLWVAVGRYKVYGPENNPPERCSDGIDNDGDGLVDCADYLDCAGQPGPGTMCCDASHPCSAKDSDDDKPVEQQIYTKGVCTQYICSGYGCALDKIYVDNCENKDKVYEYTAPGTSCVRTSYNCPLGYGCYDGKCIPRECEGSLVLTLDPSKQEAGKTVKPNASGLSFCYDKVVHFKKGYCEGTEVDSCTLTDGSGCGGLGFAAPGEVGIHTYFACTDKNDLNGFNDPGEQDSAELNVTPACVPEICNDGIDNDCDGYKDCKDPDCYTTGQTGPGGSNCCGGTNPDDWCNYLDYCDQTGDELGGGDCTEKIGYCNPSNNECNVITNTYTDTCGGDADNPSVTYYSCNAANQCVGTTTIQSDTCTGVDSACSAEDWDCVTQDTNGAGLLVRNTTYMNGQDASCDGTSAVKHYVCKNTEEGYSVPDSCFPADTDCMDAGACRCEGGSCQACDPATRICVNYECISQFERCDETCDTFPMGNTGNHYFFESRCQAERPYPWFSSTTYTCNDEKTKLCYCYFKCTPYIQGANDYQCLQTNPFCAFGFSQKIGKTPYNLPFRYTNGDGREEFKIPAQPSELTGVKIEVNPGSGYDLYVKIGDVCPDSSTYDCKGSDVGGKKVCTVDIPATIVTRIAVYNVSATSSYNISVIHSGLTYVLGELLVPITETTTTSTITTTTSVSVTTTTTTISRWRSIPLGLTEFFKKLFSRFRKV